MPLWALTSTGGNHLELSDVTTRLLTAPQEPYIANREGGEVRCPGSARRFERPYQIQVAFTATS